MEVLARYVERTDRELYVLIRAPDDAAAAARLRATMGTLYGSETAHPGRVNALAADIESDGLGLEAARRAALAERVSDIVHSAASVSFSLPLDQSRNVNVGGTRRLLDFAREAQASGGLTRFAYVSTAYVAGTHEGEFREDQLDVGQDFRNAYERSKFEAETLVREEADRLPVQIFRPSIIVGERTTGWTASFNVLYAPLKAFARGALRVLPAHSSAPVDVVPVDYVADAIFAVATAPVESRAETLHLVAGQEATTVGRLASLGARHFGSRPPRVLPPRPVPAPPPPAADARPPAAEPPGAREKRGVLPLLHDARRVRRPQGACPARPAGDPRELGRGLSRPPDRLRAGGRLGASPAQQERGDPAVAPGHAASATATSPRRPSSSRARPRAARSA
jgi:long-chain acyl-CoA synthetase